MESLLNKSYDIVVIGAGPAGSIASKYAALNGSDVLMVERKQRVGFPIQCAGFIPDSYELKKLIPSMKLPDEAINIPKSAILQKIENQRFYTADLFKKEFKVDGYVLDRTVYDSDLAQKAVDSGVTLCTETTATGFSSINNTISETKETVVKLKNDGKTYEVKTKVVIGADGPISVVARNIPGFLNYNNGHRSLDVSNNTDISTSSSKSSNNTDISTNRSNSSNNTDISTNSSNSSNISNSIKSSNNLISRVPYERGIGYGYKMTETDTDPKTLEMFFGSEIVPGGYVWIFPEGENRVNVGIGVRRSLMKKPKSAKYYLDNFIKKHPIGSKRLSGGKIESVISGIIPVDGAPEKTVNGNFLIAGDAAGHVTATNGGGLPFAMAGALIAGEVSAGFVSGKYDSLENYELLWKKTFGKALDSSVQARRMADKIMSSDKLMSKMIQLTPSSQLKKMQCGKIPATFSYLIKRFV